MTSESLTVAECRTRVTGGSTTAMTLGENYIDNQDRHWTTNTVTAVTIPTAAEAWASPSAHIAVHDWLNSYEGEPVQESWVPGASEVERRRLAALGGLVRSLIVEGNNPKLGTKLPIGLDTGDMNRWIASGPVPPAAVVSAGKLILEEEEDGLAAVYSRAVTPSNRRRLGTFFTPKVEVQWMLARWVELHSAPKSVVDVGAGVGAFTVTAGNLWPDADIWAVDVNPVTLGLLGLRLSNAGCKLSRDSAGAGAGVRLVLDDYVAWATRQWHTLRPGRLVLGNPPYTRLQLLPVQDRITLGEAAGDLCGSRASLSALITAASIQLLHAQDGICLLLPAQWLEADYAQGLRQWLWGACDRRIDLHLFESDLFADAHVDAVALIVGPSQSDPQPFVTSSSAHGGGDRSFENRVPRNRQDDCPSQWRSFYSGVAAEVSDPLDQPLNNFARIKRGVATGGNHFFVLSEDTRDMHALPESVLVPLLRKVIDHASDTVTSSMMQNLERPRRKYLLNVTRGEAELASVERYLARGADMHVDQGRLCSNRTVWFELSKEISIPDVIVGPATKTGFRFLVNEAKAAITNNLYGLVWHETTPEKVRQQILTWLRGSRGQEALVAIARTQGGGLKKLEPRALNALVLPTSAFTVS